MMIYFIKLLLIMEYIVNKDINLLLSAKKKNIGKLMRNIRNAYGEENIIIKYL